MFRGLFDKIKILPMIESLISFVLLAIGMVGAYQQSKPIDSVSIGYKIWHLKKYGTWPIKHGVFQGITTKKIEYWT